MSFPTCDRAHSSRFVGFLHGIICSFIFKRASSKNDEDLIEAMKTRNITDVPDAVGWAYEEELLISLFKTNPELATLLEMTFERAYHIKHHGFHSNLNQYCLM